MRVSSEEVDYEGKYLSCISEYENEYKNEYEYSNVTEHENEDGGDYDNELPLVEIIATGGTIASSANCTLLTAGYSVNLTIENLVQKIPELKGLAHIETKQIFNIGSNELTSKNLVELREFILGLVGDREKKIDGIVITHGTDTLEETSFFLEMTLKVSVPIVLTGSMRPSSALSSDGIMNLYQAVYVASRKQESLNRGILVNLNDRILSGFYISKGNANSLDTFKNFEQGNLGMFINNEIVWFIGNESRFNRLSGFFSNFRLKGRGGHLPEVIILYGYQELNPALVELAITQLHARGIVLAGTGSGSWTEQGNLVALEASQKHGIPVVYSSRTLNGIVPIENLPVVVEGRAFTHAIASGFLNPQKTRILLQLCLNENYSVDEIKRVFRNVYGGGILENGS
ncbi:cytosolic L-asparaginase [Ascoidea rubescens DSM 1968]|uniref:asparaginase n=1 Tax=Ascoidea rubescens DSM 1968 TaxID=1344418 RepID=A0A1D2VIX8_9ASCO|nr:cytosolic L-asparaginase [Ascoidea rubescens DSM 1968]ODV61584.1 cytosolic L-asparaginase [Ascoidea rubescens DSM 1968]